MNTRSMFVALALVACGDNAEPFTDEPPTPGPSDRWLVQTTVEGPSGRTSYAQVAASLETANDLARAVEIAGNGRVYFRAPDLLYMGSPESPVITRYTIEDDNRLAPGARLSFVMAGFSSLPFGNTFASDQRALLLDGDSLTGAIWNPAQGTLSGELDLRQLDRADLDLAIDPGVVRGNRLFVPLQYTNFSQLAVFPGVAIAVIDIASAAIVNVITDARCLGGFTGITAAEDGTIYVVGDSYGGLVRFVNPSTPATCLLRIQPGQEVFDASWQFSFANALGGREGVGMVYSGQGIAFVAALYPERLDDPGDLAGFAFDDAARWWRVDLATGAGTELATPYHSIGQSVGYVQDGRVLLSAPEAGYRGTTPLYDVNPTTGAATLLARFTGVITKVAHLPAAP